MARELGLNPAKLGKLDNHQQGPWKAPLPQFIEHLYVLNVAGLNARRSLLWRKPSGSLDTVGNADQMKSLADQLPALIGVVLGAVGAMVAASLTDRLRWRREQEVRWDQRRLDVYVTFASTLKEIHTVAFRVTAARRPGSYSPIEREAGLELMARANLQKTKDWESVLLLGDEGTVTAARRWRDAVGVVERIAGDPQWDGPQWDSAVDEVNIARDSFHTAARRGLGVRGGSVEQVSYLRLRRTGHRDSE